MPSPTVKAKFPTLVVLLQVAQLKIQTSGTPTKKLEEGNHKELDKKEGEGESFEAGCASSSSITGNPNLKDPAKELHEENDNELDTKKGEGRII